MMAAALGALGTLTAGLLAIGFALVGEALLGRVSRDIFAWNESFLVGAATCAAALFPVTLVVHSVALDAELVLIVLSALAVLRRRFRRAANPEPPRLSGELGAIWGDGIAILLSAAIVFVTLFFGALNLWNGHSWDSVQVWGTRAKMLFVQGGLSRRWFPEDSYDARLLAYPPLISFFEALFCRVRGTFDLDRVKPIFPFFYASMLLSTYTAARMLCSLRWALGTVLLVALLPELTTGLAAGGYADMPLAAFVAAVVAACLRTDSAGSGWRSPLPWLIGAMTTVKQEGMILALIACGGISIYWLTERPLRLAARIRSEWTGAIVILSFIAARVGYVRWIGIDDATWGPFDAEHRARAVKSVGLVASLCLRSVLDPTEWGLFWPAFFLASVLVAAYGFARPTHLAIATTAAIVVYAAIFLLSNWSIEQHIAGAYSRLLAQLAPAAAVVIGAAGHRIWSVPVRAAA